MRNLHGFLADLLALLEQAKIPHMVTGSIASTYYGRPRGTQDVDVVIDPDEKGLEHFVHAAAEGGYYADSEDAAGALKRRSTFNVIDGSSGYKLEWAKADPSERQFLDALGIAVIRDEALDISYMKNWASQLGVSDLLERLLMEPRRGDRG